MSKPNMDKIEFHATVAVDRGEIAQSKGDVLMWRKDKQAMDLGKLIADTKGWKMNPAANLVICHLDLYVFTKIELWDFIDYRIKQKLIEMAGRDHEKDIKDRLLMLSERV
jgi:hypothetical protein